MQRLVIRGRPRMLGLGGYPLAEKRHGQGVPAGEEAAAVVLEQQRPGWRNAKHARDWPRSLRAYAFPRIGAVPVSEVTTADVLAILTPIWHDKPETARRATPSSRPSGDSRPSSSCAFYLFIRAPQT